MTSAQACFQSIIFLFYSLSSLGHYFFAKLQFSWLQIFWHMKIIFSWNILINIQHAIFLCGIFDSKTWKPDTTALFKNISDKLSQKHIVRELRYCHLSKWEKFLFLLSSFKILFILYSIRGRCIWTGTTRNRNVEILQ